MKVWRCVSPNVGPFHIYPERPGLIACDPAYSFHEKCGEMQLVPVVTGDGPRLFVTAEEHQAQWDSGWPDFHPEDYCQRCFGRNIKSWYVDSPLWNVTELRGGEIVCPQCFAELYAEATGDWQVWQIRLDRRPDNDLRTAIFKILDGWPYASKEFLAHRIAVEVGDVLADSDTTPRLIVDEDGEWRIDLGSTRGEKNVIDNLPDTGERLEYLLIPGW